MSPGQPGAEASTMGEAAAAAVNVLALLAATGNGVRGESLGAAPGRYVREK